MDDLTFTFFAIVLNFSLEFDVTSRFSDSLPSLVFSDTQEDVKIVNRCSCTNSFSYLNNNLQNQEKSTDNTTKDMVKWYDISKNSNLDRSISMFIQKKKVITQVVVPIHNNGRFIIIDFFLPFIKRAHGEVIIFDYLNKGVNQTNLRAKIWHAKFFSIYWKTTFTQ